MKALRCAADGLAEKEQLEKLQEAGYGSIMFDNTVHEWLLKVIGKHMFWKDVSLRTVKGI